MKPILLFASLCLFAAGCASHTDEPAMENGNGIGGANVAGSFPGSAGAGAKSATGAAQGAPNAPSTGSNH